jgi:hypothetical protein
MLFAESVPLIAREFGNSRGPLPHCLTFASLAYATDRRGTHHGYNRAHRRLEAGHRVAERTPLRARAPRQQYPALPGP